MIELEHDIKLPRQFQVILAKQVQAYAESVAREISSDELSKVFFDNFMNVGSAIELVNYWPYPDEKDPSRIHGKVELKLNGEAHELTAEDNGPIAAFVKACRHLDLPEFTLESYEEDSIGSSATAEAVTFVTLKRIDSDELFYGIARNNNISQAAVSAVIVAMNNLIK
ncbi:MAG: hypothetical protein HRT88_16115, partial [Lentisphaeraceae bacterium]|nr:hypothetical protein [Lentisphaeraceae bacterium]